MRGRNTQLHVHLRHAEEHFKMPDRHNDPLWRQVLSSWLNVHWEVVDNRLQCDLILARIVQLLRVDLFDLGELWQFHFGAHFDEPYRYVRIETKHQVSDLGDGP